MWSDVIDTLSAHGIPLEVLTEDVTVEGVTHYRMSDVTWPGLREGRATASGSWTTESCTRTYRPNDVRVSTDHPLGTLAVALLEPRGEQSFFYYGFFNSVFQQNEESENYIMLPLAERLLADYPDIASDWDTYVSENPDYVESDVVAFFFPYTDFYDTEAYVYPVGIVYPEDDGGGDDSGGTVPTPTTSPGDGDAEPTPPQVDGGLVSPTAAPSTTSSAAPVGSFSFILADFTIGATPKDEDGTSTSLSRLVLLAWNHGLSFTILLLPTFSIMLAMEP